MDDTSPFLLTRLYPTTARVPLAGAYLAHALRQRAQPERPFVYTNFIASLDGRIAMVDRQSGKSSIPGAIANPNDWRLFLELAAQADLVVTSGARLRALVSQASAAVRFVPDLAGGDLAQWRRAHNLPPFPACAIFTSDANRLPLAALRQREHDDLIVLTATPPNAASRTLQGNGLTLIHTGVGAMPAHALLDMARERGYATVYSIGGPRVLHTLTHGAVLDRVYLTSAHRLLGGEAFHTLTFGAEFSPPPALALRELYLHAATGNTPEMLFGCYDIAR